MTAAAALALLYPGCTISEIALAADRLVRSGHEMRWWTPDGAVVEDLAGLRIGPSIDLPSDIVAASAEATVILVPGGDPGSVQPQGQPSNDSRIMTRLWSSASKPSRS